MKEGKTNDALANATAQSQFGRFAAPLVDDALRHAHALEQSDDAEVLHKLRVALRRLRTLFWAYRPILDDAFDDKQRALLRYLAQAAGNTRDWDILIELLASQGDKKLASALSEQRNNALKTSKETLANADIKGVLREAVSGANRELNTAHERVVLKQFASKRVTDAQRQLDKRVKKAKRSDYASFHDVRKAGKKVRYLLEFFEPLLKAKKRKDRKDLKRMQKRFGALNDVVASRNLLSRSDALPEGISTKRAVRTLKAEQKLRMKRAAKTLR